MNKRWWGATLLAGGMMIVPVSGYTADNAVPEGYRETMQSINRTRTLDLQTVSRDLHIFKLTDQLWVHRSFFDLGGQRLHANGMLLLDEQRITVIDSPWTPAASYDLLNWLDSNHPGVPVRLVITHAHDDRMGGLDPFAERLIPVYSKKETAELARREGWTAPNYVFEKQLPLRSGERALELFFPGSAHTPDNIMVWFPNEKVLFGGCMVKSAHAESLGYVGDADRAAWPESLRQALARYPGAGRVIPGHGLPGHTDLVAHTLELLGEN